MSTGPEPPQPPPDPQEPTGPSPTNVPPSSAQPGPPPGHGEVSPAGPPAPGYHGQVPPPAGGYPPGPAPMRPDEERIWAIAAHLGPLLVGLFAPLLVWLIFKDRSAFLDRTGKEALNMQISYLIYGVAAGLSIFLLVGILLLPMVMLAWLVLMIIASVKVANFEDFRYPAIIRFVS